MGFKFGKETAYELHHNILNDYHGVLSKVSRLEELEKEHKKEIEMVQVISEEKRHLINDAESIKDFLKKQKGSLSRLIFLYYFEGYTLSEIATILKYSYNHIGNIHAEFARYRKAQGGEIT